MFLLTSHLKFSPIKARARIAATILICLAGAAGAHAQAADDAARNSYPNPYRTIENWAKLPEGRTWGAAAGVDVDRHGNIWVAERCGANSCAGSDLAPILEFNSSGKLLKSFGAACSYFLTASMLTGTETSG